ncbi:MULTISPECIES: 1,2-phenylacetyl-CoA epoxidase subunit PaaE [Ramlibacter]|uniref:Phenylacetate-CoA oxygenase/reductase subunit PaaK n=1 Tax=Ramlibacter aquaticus TaxID=2780094 RepID=A0ABR9S9W8_9BURK|nr:MULTISPECIES: 1,2-phenylacetyl-CoA epoxidase subunit PaaE [Ramlibacter]MBE7939148.1 phenylacetate-CoA oxygenase/reductase subunit PaaK [Ramlibacter aquaticus]
MALHFHSLPVKRVTPEAAGAASITFAVPPALRDAYAFTPGQFLTLRARVDGEDLRRSYSICSPRQRYDGALEIEVGIKPVEGGRFSRWAVQNLQPGSTLEVLPPDGRFTPRVPGARHRVGFAAGSGITPLLSIIATTLESEPDSRFTLVYGNQRVGSIMFNEALQDLKDRHPARLKLVHLLSRQPQELAVLNGRLDEAKATELLQGLVPAADIDEAFLCGPEPMIEGVERALLAAGVARERIHAERFLTGAPGAAAARAQAPAAAAPADVQLDVVLDGKTWHLGMNHDGRVLDAALDAGLDLPYSCKGGVCCTCRAKLVEGQVAMEKNFTLEPWEIEKGFVLTCQARPLTPRVVVSYDER